MLHRGALRHSCRKFAPIICQSLARWFGRKFGPNFNRRFFLRISVIYPWRWLVLFLEFCCIAFCKVDLILSFLPRFIFVSLRILFAENQFELGSYAVLLLWCWTFLCCQTKTPVLLRFHCVGHNTAKPRGHRLATDTFSSFFRFFLGFGNRPYRPKAVGTPAGYRRILLLFRLARLSVPRPYPVCV